MGNIGFTGCIPDIGMKGAAIITVNYIYKNTKVIFTEHFNVTKIPGVSPKYSSGRQVPSTSLDLVPLPV